jgi:hypothetical protein
MSDEKPKSGFHDKLAPIPAEHFDNDFPPKATPKKGTDPVHDAVDEQVSNIKPKK